VTDLGPPLLDLLTKQPVEGTLLAERLTKGPLAAEEALKYAIEVGTQLHKAHAQGMVHGSLSPHVICIASGGARVLGPGPNAAAYRAPEQVRGEAADSRSDVFAFGSILYEMVAGTMAFHGEGEELNRSILQDPVPTLTLRSPAYDAIARVIAGCLEKNPAARRQRIQNAVIELRFAAKTSRILNGPPRASKAAATPQPASLSPQPLAAVPVPGAAKPRPVEPPRAEEFFRKPGEPALRRRNESEVGWRTLFKGDGSLSLTGFRMRLWAFIGACLVLLASAALGAALYFRPRPAPPVLKFAVAPPEHTSFPGSPSVSPDGRLLVFSAQGPEGQRMLWLRPLDAYRHSPISGTEGATNPFWSPDSKFLGYFSGHTLKTVRIRDGLTDTICTVEGANGGGTWNRDGTILFARNIDDGLYQVRAKANSKPAPVVKVSPGKGENGYMWPQFLPDGKHFLFYIQTENLETSGVYTGALDSTDYRLLFPSETNALYSALPDSDSQRNGYLLFINNRRLMGQAFHASKLTVSGEPVTLADDIGAVSSLNLAPISVANNGTLVYQSTGMPTRQLMWLDRSGTQLAAVREPGEWGPPRISPDGRRAAVARIGDDNQNADLWLVDGNGGMKLLSHLPGASEGCPVWSPDGSKIASWITGREGTYDIYVQPVDAAGRPELLFRSSFPKYPTDWSHDGRYVLFNARSDSTKYDIWAVSTADRHAGAILDTVNSEAYAALSPDGKWLAYQSDESGSVEVYVQQFDGIRSGTRKRWKISSGGGGLPRWRADGKELFYLTANGRMMAASIRQSGQDLQFDAPVKLFQTHPIRGSWNLYDVAPDGQRFLLNNPLEWAVSSDIMVVTNWTEKLKE
jgi:eukaryotic-like serine/threonine-protein kinase